MTHRTSLGLAALAALALESFLVAVALSPPAAAAPAAAPVVEQASAEGAPAGMPTSAADSPAPPEAGKAAPDSVLDLPALRGKVVWLDFWASWCAPCRKSFPWLSQIQSRFGDEGLVVIGVNVDRERKPADEFLQKHSPGFRIVYDPAGKLARQFDLKGMPSSFLIDREGKRRLDHVGFREGDVPALEKELRNVLEEGAKTP